MNKLLTDFCNYLGEKGYYKFVDSNAVINDFLKSMQYQDPKNGSKSFSRTLNYPFEGNINISFFALEQLISNTLEIGIERYLIDKGEKKEFMSQSAAQLKYGRRAIDRWKSEGKIKPIIQKRRIKFRCIDLERMSKTDELYSKFIKKD